MNAKEWMIEVVENKETLLSLIRNYHPSSQERGRPRYYGRITAPEAEQACQNIREKIREENSDNPVTRFEAALLNNNAIEVIRILEEAWFGVPESTGCWSITGFPQAVDLLDDPPDDIEE
jgi:hypothetical protein